MGKTLSTTVMALLLSTSCCGPGSRTASSDPAFTWQIVTFNFVTTNSASYDLGSFPWGAGELPGGGAWLNFPSYASEADAREGENVIRFWRIYSQPQSLLAYPSLDVSVAVETQGTPEFFWRTESDNTCDAPAAARPMLFAWYYGAFLPTEEWWSHFVSYTLAPGSALLSTPFTPDQWSDENGLFADTDSDTLGGFNLSLSQMHGIGVSFGGGCFYGHGVSVVGGQAKFILNSLVPPP